MTEQPANGVRANPKILRKLIYAIILLYFIYPLLYRYSFYSRLDYLFINAIDPIAYGVWAVIGILAVITVVYCILLRKKMAITKKQAVAYSIISILLALAFYYYPGLISLLDFVMNA